MSRCSSSDAPSTAPAEAASVSSRVCGGFRPVAVYDGHGLRHGNRLSGPAMVEQRNTSLFVGAAFDLVVDALGSFVVYRRGREDALPASIREEA